MEGELSFKGANYSFIRDASGFILVADGTRLSTLDTALGLRDRALEKLGYETPHVLVLNKCDLEDKWVVSEEDMRSFALMKMPVFKTSAKAGVSVNEAFESMAALL